MGYASEGWPDLDSFSEPPRSLFVITRLHSIFCDLVFRSKPTSDCSEFVTCVKSKMFSNLNTSTWMKGMQGACKGYALKGPSIWSVYGRSNKGSSQTDNCFQLRKQNTTATSHESCKGKCDFDSHPGVCLGEPSRPPRLSNKPQQLGGLNVPSESSDGDETHAQCW